MDILKYGTMATCISSGGDGGRYPDKKIADNPHHYDTFFQINITSEAQFRGLLEYPGDDISNAIITNIEINDFDFDHKIFNNVIFNNVTFNHCRLGLNSFRNSTLTNVNFNHCRLYANDFYNSRLTDVDMSTSEIEHGFIFFDESCILHNVDLIPEYADNDVCNIF
jgi:uncharacterized protein YjbI with pentapeptide repeats